MPEELRLSATKGERGLLGKRSLGVCGFRGLGFGGLAALLDSISRVLVSRILLLAVH